MECLKKICKKLSFGQSDELLQQHENEQNVDIENQQDDNQEEDKLDSKDIEIIIEENKEENLIDFSKSGIVTKLHMQKLQQKNSEIQNWTYIKFNFSNCKINPICISQFGEILQNWTNLQHLNLNFVGIQGMQNYQITDQERININGVFFKGIRNLNNLEKLNLNFSNTQNFFEIYQLISEISNIQKLQEFCLIVRGININFGNKFKNVNPNNQLRKFIINSSASFINDQDILNWSELFQNFQNLEEISFQLVRAYITVLSFKYLIESCSKLKFLSALALNFMGIQYTDEKNNQCQIKISSKSNCFPHIKRISISVAKTNNIYKFFVSQFIGVLKQCQKIEFLDLDLRHLQLGEQNEEEIYLDQLNSFVENDFQIFQNLRFLQLELIQNNPLTLNTQHLLQQISELKQLTEFNLSLTCKTDSEKLEENFQNNIFIIRKCPSLIRFKYESHNLFQGYSFLLEKFLEMLFQIKYLVQFKFLPTLSDNQLKKNNQQIVQHKLLVNKQRAKKSLITLIFKVKQAKLFVLEQQLINFDLIEFFG